MSVHSYTATAYSHEYLLSIGPLTLMVVFLMKHAIHPVLMTKCVTILAAHVLPAMLTLTQPTALRLMNANRTPV